jgi:hypothetical protein
MPTIVCPNRGLQEWKDLAKEIGEDRAYLAFFRNGDQIPAVEMAKRVLAPTKAETAAFNPNKIQTVDYPIEKLKLSKDVPNFKGNASEETGTVAGQELKGKYVRRGTAPIVAWERLNGDVEIITGRHRYDLAKRNKEKTIPTQIVREADGFTKAQALTFDAEANIRDGQGEVSDYANYFKNTNISETEAGTRGLLSRVKGKAGWSLAKSATDDVYALWRTGKITDAQAVAIAESAPLDAAAQQIGSKFALQGKSPDFISNVIKASKAEAGQRAQSLDLFGSDDSAMNQMAEQADRASEFQRNIRDRIRILQAGKKVEIAKSENIDVKNPAAIPQRIQSLKSELIRWENWPLQPDLVAKVRGEASVKTAVKPIEEKPTVEPVKQEVKGGELFAPSEIPFNLAGGTEKFVEPTKSTTFFGDETLLQNDLFKIQEIVKDIDPGKSANAAEKMYGSPAEAIKRIESQLATMAKDPKAYKSFDKAQRQRLQDVISLLRERETAKPTSPIEPVPPVEPIASKPAPIEKLPLEILSTATQVKITAPKAATSIRVTRPDGKSVVVPLQGTGSINKGDNPLRGETWTKIEAGTIAVSGTAKGQFRRLDGDAAGQVEVKDATPPKPDVTYSLKTDNTPESNEKLTPINTVAEVQAVKLLISGLLNANPNIGSAARASIQNIKPVESPARQGAARLDVDGEAWKAISKCFNEHIVLIDLGDNPLNLEGVAVNGVPNTLFLNARATRTLSSLVGHEMLHDIENEQPEIYNELVEKLAALIKPGAFEKYLETRKRIAAKSGDTMTNELVREEFVADLFERSFNDPKFWDTLSAKEPSLFSKLAQVVLKFLNNLIAKLKDNGAYKYFTDIGKAHDVIAGALAKFAKEMQAKPPSEGGAVPNLAAVHNTRSDKLRHMLKMGGLPVPSIAIIRPDKAGFDSFGDITLVGNSDLVTPSRDTKVLNADAYSPRYPTVNYFPDQKGVSRIQEMVQKTLSKLTGDHARSFSKFNLFNESPEKDSATALKGSPEMMLAYLDSNGKIPEFPKAKDDRYQQENDRQEVRRAVEYDKTEKPLFDKWVDDQIAKHELTDNEKIYRGFTPSGNRSYLPHNLDNVVREMKKGFADAEGFNYGVGSIRALAGKQFRTLEGIQSDRDKIVSKATMDELKGEVDGEFLKLEESANAHRANKIEGFGRLDAFSDDMKAMAQGGSENWKYLREQYPGGEPFPAMRAFLEKLKNMPTEYFEAKPKRAVGLHEFTGAVVPEGTDADLIDQLKKHGLDVRTYPKGDQEARRQTVQDLASENKVMFAKGELPGEPVAPEEKRAQVAGMPEIGQVRPTESIEETTKQIRDTLFDGSKPVSKEATDRAWNIFAEMTDPATKSGRAQQVKNQLGGSRIGLSLYKGEVMNYAFKLAVNGDSALFRAMLDHSEDFETLTGGGASTAGSALRGEGEFASEPAVKSLKDIFTVERQRAAAKGLGVDQNTLLELIKQLSDLQLSPDDLEAVINEGKTPDGRTIRDLLGENEPTPEEKTRRGRQMVDEEAQSVAERELARFELKHADVEWLKQPNKRNAVLKIIADALKSDAPIDVNPLPFIQDIQSKLVDVGVDENTAGQLAHEITVERTTKFVNARDRLMNRAANSNNIRSLIESILTMPYRAQSDPVWLHDTAVRWFESNGLAKEQAEAASRVFAKQFETAFQAARERIGNAVLAKANPNTQEDLMKLIRLGKDWMDKLAEQHGWIKPTPEQFKRLSDLQEKWSDPELSPPERNAIMEQMNGILRHIGNHDKSWLLALGESQAASLLSGIRTIDLHLFQPITSMLVRDLPTVLFSRPQDLPMMVKNLLTAAKNFFPELKFAWQKDAFGFNDAKMYGYHSELKRQFEIGVEEWKKGNYKGALRLVYAWQQYVFRALQTANQAGMAVKREFALSLYGSQVMRDAGFSTKQIGELADVVPSLKDAAYADGVERLGLDPNTARVRADHLVSEQLQDFFANKVGDNLASQAARAAELDAYSATGFKAPGIKETDEGWLSNKLGINKLMQYMRDLRKEGGFSSVVGITGFGFVNVPLRMARFNANFFGYGILRWGVYKYRMARGLETPWKQSFANETQARQRLLEGIIGSLIGFGFLGWAWNNSTADDNRKKKFFIYATGHGPLNKTLKDAWLKEGYRPFSLIIGLDGKVIGNVPITRVGGALAWPMGISAAEDDHAWAKKDAEANGRKFNESVAGDLAQMAGTYYEIIGAQGIFQGISHLQQLSQGGGGMGKVIASSLSGVAASILMPGKQLIASVSQMIWGNPDRSSIEAAIAANFPIIGAPWLHPQINRLGDPLGDNTWYGKISNLGLPIAFRVSDNPVNRELYQTLLDKGVAPADLRRTLVEERYGPLTDEQFTQFAKSSGASIKDALAGNLTQLQGMSAPDAKKFVAKAVQTADLQSASDLGLVREVSAKGKLAGNEFTGTAPTRSTSGTRLGSAFQHRASALRPTRRSLFKPKFAKLGKIPRGRMSALRGRKSSLYASHHKRHAFA